MHNQVCSKKALYEGICRDMKSILTESREELVSVSLNCKYYVSITPTTKGNEELNKRSV